MKKGAFRITISPVLFREVVTDLKSRTVTEKKELNEYYTFQTVYKLSFEISV
jgi:hypothetical protein